MTKINKFVLHGFKSFAKRTELVFGDRFNCILGPNGSGKSNVLDALCFVLGRSSAKAMRAEKSENLIYNGGKTKDPAKQGEVSIFFDNSKKTFPLDVSEVKISRIVRPNGSIYKINDKTRTRQEVIDLLAVAKIDPEGYNIILQGDIIRFVEMSPIERRGLVEEITGISIYEDKKQKALNELQKVEEQLREADIILKERDGYLKDLKKDRDQALKYQDIMKRINQNKATLLHMQITKKDDEKKDYESKISVQQKKLEEINEKIAGIKNEIQKKKEDISKINAEIEQKGEKEQLTVHKEVEQLKIELATTLSKLESYKGEIEKLKTRREQLKQNIKETEDKIKNLENDKKEIQKTISSVEKEQAQVTAKLAEFRKKHQLDNVADIEKEIDTLDKTAEEKQKEIQNFRQEQQELLRKKDRLDFQIQAIDEKIAKVLQIEKENKDQLDDLKKKRDEFKKSTAELNDRLNQDSSYAAQLGDARKRLAKSEEELARLNARNAGIQETLLGDMAVKKIIAQKGKIRGIYGTVSELGEVSSKYALALEVAAGNKIKGIVVEDDKVASECIHYLKDNKFGTATFFPLNKIRPRKVPEDLDKYKKNSGAHGLATELIKYDSKFKNVFSFIFGETLVVDNIDVAREIGIGSIKMTTLDGDVAETSGAMQGGYRQRSGAGLSFKESEVSDGIKNYESMIADLTTLIRGLERKKSENEEHITRLRTFKANLEGEVIKIEKSLHLEAGDVDVNRKLKQDISKETKDAEKEIQDIGLKISGCNSELAKNKIKRQELREKINSLRSPILVAELNAFDEKSKELSGKLVQLQSDAKNIDVQVQTMLIPEKDNIARILKQHDKEEENFKNEITSLNEKMKGLESTLKEKEKVEKEFYGKFKDLFTQRTKIDEEIKKKEEKVETIYDDSRQVEIKMNTISLENARVGAELAGLQKEFEQYAGVELLKHANEEELTKEIKNDESFLAKIGNVNMRSLEIYELVEKEYNELVNRKEKLKLEKEDVLVLMNEIESKKKELFMKTFDVVNENFKSIFSALSTKGEANLVLENKDSPFEGGLFVKVKISGNKFLDIRSLSGGEKTLTALAFIFAIQEHDPASFYVLDEVDAALDKRNSEKLAKLIGKYSDKAQYVIISHNDSLIGEADTLYGVSMDEHGVSNVVSLKV